MAPDPLTSDPGAPKPAEDRAASGQERSRRTRARNRAMLALLLSLVGLFYVIAFVRLGGLG